MKRRPLIAILAITAALLMGASPVAAHPTHPAHPDHPFPARIQLPPGWMPEGITAGRGNMIYVGSLAGGGVWAGDVRTGQGAQLIPNWGGSAAGVEYEARANRLWVAGGGTGTVRVYNATTGALLKQYVFSPAGFLNDLVVTKNAVYVTDSNNAWLDVIRLGKHGALPNAGTTLPLTGITIEPPPAFNANGVVATRGRLIVVDSVTGGLFNVNPRTGVAKSISTGGASVTNGDGLELHGNTLYVVRNQDQLVQVFRLGRRLTSAKPIGQLTSPDLSIPTTAAFQAGRLWVVNARFGIDTDDYWVTRLPAKP